MPEHQEAKVPDAAVTESGLLERRRTVADLWASEELLVRIVETVADGILLFNRQGRVTFANAAAERLLGLPREALLGRTYQNWSWQLTTVDGRPVPAQEFAFVRVLESGQPLYGVERGIGRPDGTEAVVCCNATPLFDAAGDLAGVVVSFADVSERLRLESDLRQAQKMEAVGRLAGGVAHDFNNLLTIINGYSDLLLAELPPDRPTHEKVCEVRKAGERAAALTRQLLAFGRKQILNPAVLDLNALVGGLEKNLRRLLGEDIDLDTLLDPALGRVRADPGQIEQVLLNLVANARDVTPKGGRLTVETRNAELDEAYAHAHAEARPGRYALLAVRDTGGGMDEATRSHLFEPFFTTKEVGKGTGLGLATVYGIVKQSGGHIDVASQPGHGTTFRVYLPLLDEAAAEKTMNDE